MKANTLRKNKLYMSLMSAKTDIFESESLMLQK